MSKKKNQPPSPISNWGGDSGLGSAAPGLTDRGVPPSGVRPSLANAMPNGYKPADPMSGASWRHGLLAAEAPSDDEGTPQEEAATEVPDLEKKKKRRSTAITPQHDAAEAEVMGEPSVKPAPASRRKPIREESAVKTTQPIGPTINDFGQAVKNLAEANRRLSGVLKAYEDGDPGPGKAPVPDGSVRAPTGGATIEPVFGNPHNGSSINNNRPPSLTVPALDQAAISAATSHVGQHRQGKLRPVPDGMSGLPRPAFGTAPISASKAAPAAPFSEFTSKAPDGT